MEKIKYFVKNEYFDGKIFSSHRKVEAALKRATSHEGLGWVVTDSQGNTWVTDFDGKARKE